MEHVLKNHNKIHYEGLYMYHDRKQDLLVYKNMQHLLEPTLDKRYFLECTKSFHVKKTGTKVTTSS